MKDEKVDTDENKSLKKSEELDKGKSFVATKVLGDCGMRYMWCGRIGPAQDATYSLILHYASKIIYLLQEYDQFAIKSSNLFFDQIDQIVHAL